jgi:mono/diheme cytochrome c family protein
MHEPSAYVVAGFGKKGTNDTVSPMPVVNKPPIGLSEVQIDALIAFLMSKGGFEITVELPKAEDAAVADSGGNDDEEDSGPAETAQAAIEKFTCNACHDLFDSEADAGPDLHGLGKRMDRAAIIESILKPNAKIAEGFEADLMPQDFAAQMRVSELNLIVDYLMTLEKPAGAAGDADAPEKTGQGN